MIKKQYFIYIMSNPGNIVLYTGITSDLKKRIFQHKEKLVAGFTKKYNVNKIIYYEVFEDADNAIRREKQIKDFSRAKKMELIDSMNSTWKDLYDEL